MNKVLALRPAVRRSTSARVFGGGGRQTSGRKSWARLSSEATGRDVNKTEINRAVADVDPSAKLVQPSVEDCRHGEGR